MNPPNPIIEKIKKLLALAADSGATEGERDNAIRMAHGLLAKHNLDMAQVTASQQIEGREKYQNDTWGMLWCRQVSQQALRSIGRPVPSDHLLYDGVRPLLADALRPAQRHSRLAAPVPLAGLRADQTRVGEEDEEPDQGEGGEVPHDPAGRPWRADEQRPQRQEQPGEGQVSHPLGARQRAEAPEQAGQGGAAEVAPFQRQDQHHQEGGEAQAEERLRQHAGAGLHGRGHDGHEQAGRPGDPLCGDGPGQPQRRPHPEPAQDRRDDTGPPLGVAPQAQKRGEHQRVEGRV